MTHYSDKQDGDTLSPAEKPLALKLAHWLERDGANCQQHIDAAAELRRLQADNEALREALSKCAAYLDTGATCNSDKAVAASARVALTGGKT